EFRVGIHLGDVVEEADGDLMGDGVNIGRAPRGGAEVRRHDQGFRDGGHDRRSELSLVRNDVQFRREFGGTGGTLTLHDTTSKLPANILTAGHFTNSDFNLVADSGTGTLVKFV